MTPERKVKVAVKKILEQNGVYYFMPATHGYGTSGVPDIVGCWRGKFIAIECKAKGNTPTALQELNLKRIMGSGGVALVIDETNIGLLTQYFNENAE